MSDSKTSDAISRSAVLAALHELHKQEIDEHPTVYTSIASGISQAFCVVRDVPALDVAPVVRCVDCKHRYTFVCPMYHTEICLDDLDGFDSYDTDRTDDNGFCHLGARMDGEAE